ncbi:hypothetical protein M422DRAFT_248746 [Sphaerobolus stellatus SS14]|nr:hypothetical protein M422DRAFT_248746 [Sphaerobolus stellatus SS14]
MSSFVITIVAQRGGDVTCYPITPQQSECEPMVNEFCGIVALHAPDQAINPNDAVTGCINLNSATFCQFRGVNTGTKPMATNVSDCETALVLIDQTCDSGGFSPVNLEDGTTFTYALQPVTGQCPTLPPGS